MENHVVVIRHHRIGANVDGEELRQQFHPIDQLNETPTPKITNL